VDTTQTSLLTVIKNYIPLLAFILSGIAIYLSYRANKKTERISKPKITSRTMENNKFVIHIEDYSTGKNLRIDEVYFKYFNKNKYIKINFSRKWFPSQSPPAIEVIVNENVWWNTGKVKIKTNYGKLYEYVDSFFQKSEVIKKYNLIKLLRYKHHKKKYDAQYRYPMF